MTDPTKAYLAQSILGGNGKQGRAHLQLAAIVESSDDAIISKDLTGIVLSWNKAATRIFGYTPEEMVGQSILKLIPRALYPEETFILSKLVAGEKIEHYETQRVRKDGGIIDVSLTISPIRDESGQVIAASKIARDITERKRADEARYRLAAIVESSDDAIISKDLNGIITSWNDAATRLFGYTAEEIVGKSVLTLIPPELHSEEPEILRKLSAGIKIDHHETRRLHKNGTYLDISLTVSPVRNEKGKIIGASKIARDISELKRAQMALVQSEKLAATGRMSAAIAHEINNPLEAVTNLAYLLSMDSSLNESARRYAQLILSEVARASNITRQTLSFYRDTTKPTYVSLSELWNSLLDLHRSKLQGKDIEVRRELDPEALVWAYGAELRQVFANLLLNSIDASHHHGRIAIRVHMLGDGRVRVTVADNGTGMTSETKSRVFQPFFTTKDRSGNGLGLWVSMGIVKKHGGKIQMRSTTESPHRGTVFSVTLPRVPSTLETENQPPVISEMTSRASFAK